MKRLIIALALLYFGLITIAEARPERWCGWYARHELVSSDPGPAYDVACNWQGYGSPSYAHEGALVIWCTKHHHHVGKIVGPCNADANGNTVCPVKSGNDGHAVRTRPRSVAGAVFRE